MGGGARRSRSRPALLAALALTLLCVAGTLPAAASTARLRTRYALTRFAGRGGADVVWLSANDAGMAVGEKALRNGTTDPTWFDGRRGHDLVGTLGHGAFASIDPFADSVGFAGVSSLTALFYRPGTGRILGPAGGEATGVTLGPLAAVTVPGPTGTTQAELWAPLTGRTQVIGPGRTTGIDPYGDVVGTDAGHLWYATPDGSGGTAVHVLTQLGTFTHVNALRLAVGYITQGGRPRTPVELDIASGDLHLLRRLPGYGYESLTTIDDTDKIGGVAFRNATALRRGLGVAFYQLPGRGPQLVGGLWQGRLARGEQFAGLGAITDGWLVFGALQRRGLDIGYLLAPPEIRKLLDMADLADDLPWYAVDGHTAILDQLAAMQDHLRHNQVSEACDHLADLHDDLNAEADYLENRFGSDAADEIDIYDDLVDGLDELDDELGCLPPLHYDPVEPSAQQMPYPGLF